MVVSRVETDDGYVTSTVAMIRNENLLTNHRLFEFSLRVIASVEVTYPPSIST